METSTLPGACLCSKTASARARALVNSLAMWFPSCLVWWVTSDLRISELPGKSRVATKCCQERTAVQSTKILSKTEENGAH